ncbi:hypothetical protein [Bacillus phage SRT01hs]|uniref:Uncharacterized protein n=1 Tax=Bacillus phage SRT01hs TaxID=2847044 RepID=A0A6B9SWB9_9CAUD|nr:hypothetical protein H3022_gp08 [Bacillus phage SRT01hs]QHJ75866.1 hypothetical protein [Bacillus phage SRT01hs]
MTNTVVTIKNTESYSIYESTIQLILDDKPTTQYKVLDKRNTDWSHPLTNVETPSINEMLVQLSMIDNDLYELIMEDMEVQIV